MVTMPSVMVRVQCVTVADSEAAGGDSAVRARPLLWPEPVRRASASASVTWTSAARGSPPVVSRILTLGSTQHGIQ